MMEHMSLVPYVVEQTSRGERSYDTFPGYSPAGLFFWVRE